MPPVGTEDEEDQGESDGQEQDEDEEDSTAAEAEEEAEGDTAEDQALPPAVPSVAAQQQSRCCISEDETSSQKGCFFKQEYADHTQAGGALYDDTLSLLPSSSAPFSASSATTTVTLGAARVVQGNLWEPPGKIVR